MNAVTLFKHQLTTVNHILLDVAGDLTAAEWTARPGPGRNLLGFSLWHVPACQDWIIQTWIRGVPEVRERSEWMERGGLNLSRRAFGIPLTEADAVAYDTCSADVLAYADAVLAEGLAWLETLTESDLEQVPEARPHIPPYPTYQTPEFLADVAGDWDLPVWGHLDGSCIGHCRDHLSEVMVFKEILRRTASVS